MAYIIFVMSCDKEEDPGYLRFRIGGLSNSQIKSSGPLQSLFERAKVTEFLGLYTVWLRVANLGGDNAPSLIGIRQEPATEAVIPFFNQFDEWGYTMVGNSPQLTTIKGHHHGATDMDFEAMSCTWIFHKPRPDTSNGSSYSPINSFTSPAVVNKLPKIPNPDY